MPSREELEQELQIREAEAEEDAKRIHALEAELTRTRAAAEAAGVALVVKTPEEETRTELAAVRASLESDLQAINELRLPPPLGNDAPVETPLDIVRANQRERAALQERMAMANNALSRICAALKIDRWDQDGGSAIVDKVNHFAALELRVARKLATLKKGKEMDLAIAAQIGILEWVLDANKTTKVEVNPNAPRLISFMLNGNPVAVHAAPEHTLGYLLSVALATASGCGTTPTEQWLLFAEDGARLQHTMIAREYKLAKIVATTAVGGG